MSLKVSIVPDLEDIVASIEIFLQSNCVGSDPFNTQTLIVPSLGVRSWLTPQLANRLGATLGSNDGVVANINVRYIGYLHTLIRDSCQINDDAWNRDAVNLATLRALDGFSETQRLEKKYNGRLNAARTLADRFDRYSARRPDLIRSWDKGLSALGELDSAKFDWQFKLWRRVREIIGESPWPVVMAEICEKLRQGNVLPGLPSRLMIAGFETISPSHLDLVDALSTVVDIELIFVHQSPFLAQEWNKITSQVSPNREELPIAEAFSHTSVTSLRLPPAWMKSSFELELLLSAYGMTVDYPAVQSPRMVPTNLLQQLQSTIATGDTGKSKFGVTQDVSVQIHRAHNLSRQVEILHDALLHAFEEIEGLQPDDVVILCPDPKAAAPVLEAVFEKTLINTSNEKVKIPLVVADRSLSELSPGAELSAHVLHAVTSRFDTESFLAIATHPLVARNFLVSPSDIAIWLRHMEQSRLRWGLDVSHRQQHGLLAPQITAHSWLESIERVLLGAVMPIEDQPVVVGNHIRPLPFVDSSETQPLLKLVVILSILVQLENASRTQNSLDEWCNLFAGCLSELCGNSCTELDDVLILMNQYQRAVQQIHDKTGQLLASDAVSFDQFAQYLNGDLQSTSGRQPLRTGAVTATSFIPLRTVPFKVVCILGYDDGTLPSGESEGDDLIAATAMLGDSDARLESRRILLDAMMAARDRFIVTCTGRSIKNNKLLPLVTPLAELMDFCSDCGLVNSSVNSDIASIEYVHPRHLGSHENYRSPNIDSGVQMPTSPWSFDVIGSNIAATRQKNSVSKPSRVTSVVSYEPLSAIKLDDLVLLAYKPLDYYLRKGLGISRSWVDDIEDSTLPISVDERKLGWACRDLFHVQIDNEELKSTLRSNDILPVAPFDEAALDKAILLMDAFKVAYGKKLKSEPESVEISLELPGLAVLEGIIDGFHLDDKTLTLVSFGKMTNRDVIAMTLRLLALVATGIEVEKGIMFHLSTNEKDTTPRSFTIDASLTQLVAQQRLADFLRVEPIARNVACPLFGETAQTWIHKDKKNSGAAETEFDSFVEDDFKFKKSDELIVYGASPEFDEVYHDSGGSMRTFFSSFFEVTQLAGKTGKWELTA